MFHEEFNHMLKLLSVEIWEISFNIMNGRGCASYHSYSGCTSSNFEGLLSNKTRSVQNVSTLRNIFSEFKRFVPY